MKTSKILSLLLTSAAFLPIQANANPPTTIQFPMVKSKGAGGTCPFTPSAKVTVHTLGTVENLEWSRLIGGDIFHGALDLRHFCLAALVPRPIHRNIRNNVVFVRASVSLIGQEPAA